MALHFLGIDPDSPVDESPTIWLDDTTGDLIIQSYVADGSTVDQAKEVGSIPGHSSDIPPGETIIRLPAKMRRFLPHLNGGDGATTRT